MTQKIPLPTEDQLIVAIESTTSLYQAIRLLGIARTGSSYAMLRDVIARRSIDVSHWCHVGRAPASIESAFVEDGTKGRDTLRRLILKHDLKPYMCAECGLGPEWRGKLLVLRLDHINGHSTDDRLENLRFVCPNCDSQSDTFCGRNNRGKIRVERKPLKNCIDCEGSTRSKRCKSCAIRYVNATKPPQLTKIQWPSHESLRAEVESSSYVAVAKRLGVSNTAIKKHLSRCT
jgi:hypothetical protein